MRVFLSVLCCVLFGAVGYYLEACLGLKVPVAFYLLGWTGGVVLTIIATR